MCYGIIKQHHGEIAVHSLPGSGTRFTVYLPRADAAADTPAVTFTPASGVIAPQLGRGTILLVEDAPTVRKLVQTTLGRSGFVVHTAHDGQAALELIEYENLTHIDLLLTDVVMPRMGGKELSERVRARFPRCKVLFMSGYIDDELTKAAVLSSEFALLEKPFGPPMLVRRVKEILAQP
jgi:CheY-like chemotaxis protein